MGRGNRLEVLDEVLFPHSLGIFYTAVTQFLGFPKYGDEYKVMGLAAYGEPRLLTRCAGQSCLADDGRFELDLDYFRHPSEGVTMTWEDGEPIVGPVCVALASRSCSGPRAPAGEPSSRERDHGHRRLAAGDVRGGVLPPRAAGCSERTGLQTPVPRRRLRHELRRQRQDLPPAPASRRSSSSPPPATPAPRSGAALYVWHETSASPGQLRDGARLLGARVRASAEIARRHRGRPSRASTAKSGGRRPARVGDS